METWLIDELYEAYLDEIENMSGEAKILNKEQWLIEHYDIIYEGD